MSAWRRKAIAMFPDLVGDELALASPSSLFRELLAECREAHKQRDTERLRRIYGYAEWAVHQKAEELWNAAGVTFYEKLFDAWGLHSEVARWISPGVRSEVWGLWESRLTPERLSELRRRLADANCRHQENWYSTGLIDKL